MATLREKINAYRAYYLQQLTRFINRAMELIGSHFWALSQKINRASRIIAGYLRALPNWLLTQFVHDLKQFYTGFTQLMGSLFIIAQELPEFCTQIAKTCYKTLKSIFFSTYQFLSLLVRAAITGLQNTVIVFARNIIPSLKAIGSLIRRACLNIVDDIKQIPHYITLAFILIKELLYITWETLVELNRQIINALQPVLSFLGKQALRLLTNSLVFILGFVAALFDLTLGRLFVSNEVTRSGQTAVSLVATPILGPKNAPSYTPNFDKTHSIIGNDKSADDQPQNRTSASPSALS